MSSRNLDDLAMPVKIMALNLIHAAKEHSIDLLVTCTYRSDAEQERAYAQGRTAPGLIITHARPGESAHNRTWLGKPSSLALDVVPLVNGKPYWSLDGAGWKLWQQVGSLGEMQGLEWGGRWPKSSVDYPHFQLHDWKNYHV